MKRSWLWVLLVVVVAAIGLGSVGAFRRPITVSAVTLEPCRVEQTVSCMGVIEAADTMPIILPIDCMVSDVCVKAGDRVQKGDVLITVDKEMSRQHVFGKESLMLLAALPTEITAPVEGTVVEVGALKGHLLEQGTPCMVVAADTDMQIRVAIREADLRALKCGMQVHITGDGFEKTSYDGVLTKISSKARGGEDGTVVEGVVSLAPGSFDPSLRLGLTAKATIVTSVIENGYVIPYDSIQTDSNGSYVYVFMDNRLQRKEIVEAARVPQGVLLPDASLAKMKVVRDAGAVDEEHRRVVLQETRS